MKMLKDRHLHDFKDALNELASKAGVELSYKSSKINSTIYEINQFAKELFHSNLLQSKICMDYLIDKRNFQIYINFLILFIYLFLLFFWFIFANHANWWVVIGIHIKYKIL